MGSNSAALIMEEAAARRRAAQAQTKSAPRTTVTDASLAWLLAPRPTTDKKAAGTATVLAHCPKRAAAETQIRARARAAGGEAAEAEAESGSESESSESRSGSRTEAAAAATQKPKQKPSPIIPFAQPGEDVAALLVRLSRSGADMMNSRQYERHWMHGHYTRDYAARVAEQGPGAAWMTMAESLAHFRAVAAQHPQFHIGVVDGAASVDERRGVAKVFQRLEITGQPPGMVRPGMVVLEWRRQADGRWMCCRLTGLTGVTGSGVED